MPFVLSRRQTFWQNLHRDRLAEIVAEGGNNTRASIGIYDEEIALARAYIQDISERRNALAPVSRLPAEALSAIFRQLRPVLLPSHVSEQSRPYDDQMKSIADATKTLIASSHTCRHWRAVALGDCSLWTTLWLENKPWTAEMLSRSRTTPLTVIQPPRSAPHHVSHARSQKPRSNLSDVLPSLSVTRHARQLSIELESNRHPAQTHDIESLHAILTRPAPYLEDLQIRFHAPTEVSDSRRGIFVADRFLGTHAPSLRRLSIDGLPYHAGLWRLPILSHLATLSLTWSLPLEPVEGVSLHDMLSALQTMCNLERFSIVMGQIQSGPPGHTTAAYFSSRDTSFSSITIPRLSSLALTGTLNDIAPLATHLHTPLVASVQYSLDLDEENLESGLIRELPQLTPPLEAIPSSNTIVILFSRDIKRAFKDLHFRAICLDSTKESSCRLEPIDYKQAYFSIAVNALLPTPVNPPPGANTWPFQIDEDTILRKGDDLSRAFSNCLSVSPVDRPSILHWACTFPFFPEMATPLSSNAYSTILRKLSTVEKLVLDYVYDCTGLLDTLTSTPDLLPRLDTICLRRWTFSLDDQADGINHGFGWPMFPYEERAREAADSLRRMSEVRHLQTLELFESRRLDDNMASLFDGIARELVIIDGPKLPTTPLSY